MLCIALSTLGIPTNPSLSALLSLPPSITFTDCRLRLLISLICSTKMRTTSLNSSSLAVVPLVLLGLLFCLPRLFSREAWGFVTIAELVSSFATF